MTSLWKKYVYAIIYAVSMGEKIKPIQESIRRSLNKYHLSSSKFDRKVSGLTYNIFRNLGLIDQIIYSMTKINIKEYDLFIRGILRIIAYIYQLDKLSGSETKKTIRKYCIKYLFEKYPLDKAVKIKNYIIILSSSKWTPITDEEEIMLKYKVSPELYTALYKAFKILGEDLDTFLIETLKPLPHVFRVNSLKASRDAIIKYLRDSGYSVEKGKYSNQAVRIYGSLGKEVLRLVETGILVPQDESSMVAVELLDPWENMDIADLCAAPGGKTTYIAERTSLRSRIYSFELYKDRVKRLRLLLERTGTEKAVQIYVMDARRAFEKLGTNSMDRVLVDPPCSTTGALARNPDVRWRYNEKDVEKLIELQYEILEAGWKILRRGGLLLYTTCSVLPWEGEYVISKFLKNKGDVEIIKLSKPFARSGILPSTMRSWPHRHGVIGFYYALMKKK